MEEDSSAGRLAPTQQDLLSWESVLTKWYPGSRQTTRVGQDHGGRMGGQTPQGKAAAFGGQKGLARRSAWSHCHDGTFGLYVWSPLILTNAQVEWYPSPTQAVSAAIKLNEDDSASSSSDSGEDSDNSGTKEMKEFRQSHKNNKAKICDALAHLGIYANSIKPTQGWLDRGKCSFVQLCNFLTASRNHRTHACSH